MRRSVVAMLCVALLLFVLPGSALAAISGAVFTTESVCNGTNVNIFDAKDEVFLDGGPSHEGAAGLPDGNYYVKVTEPNGTLLGATTTASVSVVGGEFTVCYQLSAILFTATSGLTVQGYDTTSNAGGEYKVWASQDPTFPNSNSKTDNFKVDDEGGEVDPATLNVIKFYDANANGINDDAQPIVGWKIHIQDGIDLVRFTPVSVEVAPDDYIVTEFLPIEPNWVSTTTNPVLITLVAGQDATVEFGNLCLGEGGGHTLGFWSNRNGQRLIGATDLALLTALNLRNASGAHFDPTSASSFRTWILSATATNMAYMLSAQLAAMELNVLNGFVSGTSLIHAPGTSSANALGFATVNAVMAEANTLLGSANPLVIGSSHPQRELAEALKDALDDANNDATFVQSTPCAFTFAD
jgi:hypothetical protein